MRKNELQALKDRLDGIYLDDPGDPRFPVSQPPRKSGVVAELQRKLDRELADLRSEVRTRRSSDITISCLQDENKTLKERLSKLEARLSKLDGGEREPTTSAPIGSNDFWTVPMLTFFRNPGKIEQLEANQREMDKQISRLREPGKYYAAGKTVYRKGKKIDKHHTTAGSESDAKKIAADLNACCEKTDG